ncbi:MAG: alpha/beta hydrolase [Crocinitomicaceae bacterium]
MENNFTFSKTFRFETINEDKQPTKIIYALHGYGQLAKYFIRKFDAINEDYLIVAPEGMHRFYLNGSSGKVGASWMTKEARETDIKDNIEWLNALDTELSERYNIKERVLVGFSQGGATAIRWKMNALQPFDKTIIWASDFPPDMEPMMEQLKGGKENYFVIGNEDEYFNEEQQNKLISLYKSVDFKISTYIGRHNIELPILLQLLEN